MQVIYADTLFVVNLIINYLVLLASAKLCALQASRLRMGLGAALGGIYSVLTLLFPFFQQAVVKITVGVFMTMTAFGGYRRLLRIILTVFAVSATFAGVIYALTLMTSGETTDGRYIVVSFKMLILSFGICYFVVSLVFRRLSRVSSETVRITVEHRGKRSEFTALKDTGHSLTDPITGKPVIIAGAETMTTLFEKDVMRLLEKPPVTAMEKLGDRGYGFRLIPYSAVGVENGMLLAFKPDALKINGKKVKDCLIAVSPNRVSDGGAYSALIGVDYH